METQPKKHKKVVLIIIVASLIVLGGLFLYLGGYQVLKEGYQRWHESKQAYEAMQKFEQAMKEYNKTLEEDTYGGKTPQETLDMFISALEQGDIDLAAKYFVLDENLSRKQWEDGLKKAEQESKISEIISLCRKFKPALTQSWVTTTYEFVILGEDGVADYIMQMEFNNYSGVWKIESM